MANPNPSPATRFGAGNRANPSGKTSAQRGTEYQNAEAATRAYALLIPNINHRQARAGLQRTSSE